MPTVSIVIPCFNERDTVEALIAAVKKVERGEADASPDLLAGI